MQAEKIMVLVRTFMDMALSNAGDELVYLEY